MCLKTGFSLFAGRLCHMSSISRGFGIHCNEVNVFKQCTRASRATSHLSSASVIWYTVLFRQKNTDRPDAEIGGRVELPSVCMPHRAWTFAADDLLKVYLSVRRRASAFSTNISTKKRRSGSRGGRRVDNSPLALKRGRKPCQTTSIDKGRGCPYNSPHG
jgi:hypothetical protein